MTYQERHQERMALAMRQQMRNRVIMHAATQDGNKWAAIRMVLMYGGSLRTCAGMLRGVRGGSRGTVTGRWGHNLPPMQEVHKGSHSGRVSAEHPNPGKVPRLISMDYSAVERRIERWFLHD